MLQTYKTLFLPATQNIRLSKYRGQRDRCVPSTDTTITGGQGTRETTWIGSKDSLLFQLMHIFTKS